MASNKINCDKIVDQGHNLQKEIGQANSLLQTNLVSWIFKYLKKFINNNIAEKLKA